MTHYIEIIVLPDPEFKESVLMNALYSKLHRAIGQIALGKVGLSFPNHQKTLGDKIRLHGSSATLEPFTTNEWLKGLRDYTQVTATKPIPENTQHRTVQRVQVKSAHNKRKRSVAKGWLTEEQAFEEIPDGTQKRLTLPFAQLRSLSNDNSMRIYIKHGELTNQPKAGEFSSYGLSAIATIPWF